MAVDWNLASPDNGYDYLKTLQVLGQSQAQQQAIRTSQAALQEKAQIQASRGVTAQKLAAGDYSGAQQNALQAGDFDYATPIAKLGDDHKTQIGNEAAAMGSIAAQLRQLPPQQRAAAYQAALPALKQAGFADHELDGIDLSDNSLNGYIGTAQKVTDTITQQQADRRQTFAENKVDYVPVPQGGFLQGVLPTGGLYNGNQAPGGAQPAPSPAQGSTGPVDARTLYFTGIKPQESGGQPNGGAGAIGQPTQYGTAQGSSQMLPATAQATAQKLGIPWRPDLMTGTTPEALHYQDTLGVGYTQEALDASGGDPVKAAAYYYGGPNPNIHGPKTAQYAQQVAARLQPGQPQTATDAPNQPGLQPGGGQVQGGRITGNPKTADVPSGYRQNPDGSLAFIPGGPADPAVAAKGKTSLTESQGKATAYFARANLALQQLAGVDPKAPPPGAAAQFADELPLGVGQHFISDNNQQQLNARRAFIAAVLRQESGAAISQGEFNSYNKLYFDQTGDSAKVKANKAALRQSAVQSLKIEAGPGANQVDGAPAPSGHPSDIDAIMRKYGVH